MSEDETSPIEWKTVRIQATSYYKLVELSGLFTMFFGLQSIPISTVADWSVSSFYNKMYSKLQETLSDPDKLEAMRKEFGGSLKRLMDLWKKPTFE